VIASGRLEADTTHDETLVSGPGDLVRFEDTPGRGAHHTRPRTRAGRSFAPGRDRARSYHAVMSRDEPFSDLLAANAAYAGDFALAGLPARAARGLAVLTCIDSRIEPLAMLGLAPGDAKILRNAGARVTDDVLRTLVLASYLLGVDRVMVVAHTKCRMAAGGEEDVHEAVAAAGGPDTRSLAFLVTADQQATLRGDVPRVRSWPYLAHLRVGGFLYDVDTGRIGRLC